MPDGPPALAWGHRHLSVADVAASYRFYSTLGLRPFALEGGLGILELAGGTHLLLFQRGMAGAPEPEETNQPVDLMIAGRTREALEAYRADLRAKGVEAGAIPAETYFGHHYFHASDPDGNSVRVATTHASARPV